MIGILVGAEQPKPEAVQHYRIRVGPRALSRPQVSVPAFRRAEPAVSFAQANAMLLAGVRSGDTAAVRKALVDHADVHITDPHGLTPLHIACFRGHAEIIPALLEAGADINAAALSGKYQGQTPLMLAAAADQLGAVKYLLVRGADLGVQDIKKKSALDHAVLSGATGAALYLAGRGTGK